MLGDILRLRADLLNAIQYAASDGGEVSYCNVGPERITAMDRSAAAETVLSNFSTSGKPDGENPLRLVPGDGLISNPNHDERVQRRRTPQPVNSRSGLARMQRKTGIVIAERTRRWGHQDRTDPTVHEEMPAVVLDSVPISRDSGTASDIITPETASLLLDFVEQRLRGSSFSLPVRVPIRRNRAFTATVRDLDDFVCRLVNERRGSGEQHGDLLEVLPEARVGDAADPLTDLEVRDEVLTTFLAACETTASALTWVLYLLACYPDSQQRVRADVCSSASPEHDSASPGHGQPRNGTSLECVVNESMRLFPPCPTISPQVKKGAFIGQDEAPEGTPATHVPVGAGAHMRTGKGFALMEMGLLVVHIAKFFMSLRDSEGPDPMALITLRP